MATSRTSSTRQRTMSLDEPTSLSR
jgi:hypothetical protein